MDLQELELKNRKAACKRAKRKYVTLWKVLTLCFFITALLLSAAAPLSVSFDNWLAAHLGGSLQTLEGALATSQMTVQPMPAPAVAPKDPSVMPTLGARNGLTLHQMAGLPCDDPLWQAFLDQLTYRDMLALCVDTYGWCLPITSVQAPGGLVLEADLSTMPDTQQAEQLYTYGQQLAEAAIARGCCCVRIPAELLGSPMADGIRNHGVHATVTDAGKPFFWKAAYSQQAQDPAYVNDLRQQCHIELYGRANSLLMKDIGPQTTVTAQLLPVICILHWAAVGCWMLTLILLSLWLRGRRKWKQTPAYLDLRSLRNVRKTEKALRREG